MLAQSPAPLSPLIGPVEWQAIQAELPAEELPDFLAYLEDVRRGKAVMYHPEAAPYNLSPLLHPERIITQ